MANRKKYVIRLSVIRVEIGSWPPKEQDLAIFVYGLLKNIEAIDYVPFVFGMIPLALIYRGIDSGLLSIPNVLLGSHDRFLVLGTAFLIYAASAAAISKFVVKRLQLKWLSELFQKMAADKEIAHAFEKLEQLDPYLDWRIRNTYLRLGKFF